MSKLTTREKTVFTYIASGWGPTRIGEKLGISRKTVNTYRERIKTKTGLKTTQEMILYYERNQKVPGESE